MAEQESDQPAARDGKSVVIGTICVDPDTETETFTRAAATPPAADEADEEDYRTAEVLDAAIAQGKRSQPLVAALSPSADAEQRARDSDDGEVCKRCFRPVAETCPTWWSAPDNLWLQLYGNAGGIRCVPCFTKDCKERGITVYWQAVEDEAIAAALPAPRSGVE